MSTKTAIALAVLTATTGGMAVLTSVLDLSVDDEWAQLTPDGEFSAVDGRPFDVPGRKWLMNADIAAQVIARVQSRANDLVIDYEHQTLETEKNGKPAPAAGWFKEIEYRPGLGLFIKPVWTENAAEFIRKKEYRYLSAVFPYDKSTGAVLDVRMAAITNFPGLDGMQSLAALAARKFQTNQPNHGDAHMWKQLLAKLGITLADGQEPTAEQVALAETALAALKAKADQSDSLNEQVAALKANPGNVDLQQYVPVTTYNALLGAVAALRQNAENGDINQLIEKGHQDGKVLAAEKDYLQQFATQHGFAALKSLIASRPVLAALKSTQTSQTQKSDSGKTELSAEDLAVCKACGISPEDFRKTKEGMSA